MTSRRGFLLIGLGFVPKLEVLAFGNGEFWNAKASTEWTQQEVQRLLTKSPWAKEATAEMNAALMPGSNSPGSGMPGGRGGGPPMGGRGGMGGPGMGGGPGMDSGPGMGGGGGPLGGPMRLKAVVRWESAAPIREASKRQFPNDPSGSYVIAVSGLMPGGDARRENTERQQDRLNGFRETTVLQRKGKDPITPVHIDEVAKEGTLLFYFPGDVAPISLDDKEVVFRTKLGPMELKARFVLKEMQYHGKLAL